MEWVCVTNASFCIVHIKFIIEPIKDPVGAAAKEPAERGGRVEGDATGQLGNQAGIVIDSVQAEQLLFLANELRCLLVSMANSLLSTHMP